MGAALLTLAAAASWQVLAVNHMCTQTPINLIVFFLGFVPLALVLLGTGVNAVCRRPGIRVAATAGLAVSVVVAAGYSVKTSERRSEECRRTDMDAGAAVQDLIRRGDPADPGTIVCRVENIGGEKTQHPNLQVEFGWAPQTDREKREAVVFVAGWAIDRNTASRFREPRVVVAVNAEVAPPGSRDMAAPIWAGSRGGRRPDRHSFLRSPGDYSATKQRCKSAP